jgi:hypothetical protein
MKTDMEQRDQNRDSTDTEPKYQQSRKESNSEIVVEEQESGKQEEVQHRGRGKYNQYEAAEVIIEKIRSYRTQRYPDSEIMKFLDNMPRRTYYNHVKKLQEQDGQIMEQWMAENVEHVSEEMMIYRETLSQKLREVQAIIDNKKLVKFTKSSRSSDMNSAKLDRFSIL